MDFKLPFITIIFKPKFPTIRGLTHKVILNYIYFLYDELFTLNVSFIHEDVNIDP